MTDLLSSGAGAALLALPLFVSTNADDLVILALLFSQAHARVATVVAGQLVGLGALTLGSLLAARLAVQLSASWIPVLGLVPVYLGVRQLLVRADAEPEVAARKSDLRWWMVAAVTIANGGDNVGVYIPVFAVQSPAGMAVIAIAFLLLTLVWCALALAVVREPTWGMTVRRAAERFGPFVLIAVGLWILGELPVIQRVMGR